MNIFYPSYPNILKEGIFFLNSLGVIRVLAGMKKLALVPFW